MSDMAPLLVMDKELRWFSPYLDRVLCAAEEAATVAVASEVVLEAPDA